MAEKKEESGGDQSYFDQFAGDGLEGFTQDTMSTAYLGMVQPGSTIAANHTPGTWRNSATDENFGATVEVVVLAFKTVWTERSNDPPFMTVGRYEPNSIQVDIERPKPGQRGFPKMKNPITGNKIEELFVYACLRKEHPEEGLLYFSPTVGSMRTCKAWNRALCSQRTTGGKIAPIYAFSWNLQLGLVQNPARPTEQISRFIEFTRGPILQKEEFIESYKPQLIAAANVTMLAAPEASGDVE